MARKRTKRRGATAVELAMTLPILFLILFSSYELARANLLRHAARAAAYEGARVGILPGTNVSEVQAASDFVLATIGIRGAEITITPSQIEAQTPQVRVDVAIEARDNFFFAPFFFSNTIFRGDCVLSREIIK